MKRPVERTGFFIRKFFLDIQFLSVLKYSSKREYLMKYLRILLFSLFFIPSALFAATNEFVVAAQLLSAAKNADIQQVQILINSGANVNYVDSTGLSLVCTALMNGDYRAAQILQMYGADASKCDQQIKQYESKNKTNTSSGGLFSGLSSAQSLSLAAAGAAVVVGGLFLLTDVFDPGNENSNSSSSGDRPGQGGGGNNSGTSTAALTIPYGPAMPNSTSEAANYASNLNLYSPDTEGILQDNFDLMTDTYGQNYLLMMHGYSPLARGYMGQRTLRYTDRTPVPGSVLGDYSVGGLIVGGGRPVTVALITTNGINAANKPAGEATAQVNSLDDKLVAWSMMNGTTVADAQVSMLSSKYYNNTIQLGSTTDTQVDNATTSEDGTLVNNFDLSGFGTAVNNTSATASDNLLAKVIGGNDSGYSSADFMGFMPNGQMLIYRTGGGEGLVAVSGQSATGTYTMAGESLATGDTINLFDKTLTITRTGNTIVASDSDSTYTGYIGADGLLYLPNTSGGSVNQAYQMSDNNLTLVKQENTSLDYYNYKALKDAAVRYLAQDLAGGRSTPFILANASVISPLHKADSATIDDVLSYGESNMQSGFNLLVNQYYDVDKDGSVASDANNFFTGLGATYLPLVIFSTGAAETNSSYTGKTLTASFENSAPLVFDNLEHLFMSVVPVIQNGDGTAGNKTVSGYTPDNKYVISQWQNTNNTPDTTEDDTYYKGRVCGIAGTGANGIDPWCFASAGVTDELAVATAAGAAGALKSAFSYMSSQQLFALMALTADGAYLGTDSSGNSFTESSLTAYLQNMYQMPNEYEYRWQNGGENYLDVFKEVFGYGVINLERATTPGKSIYYYNGTDIVSGSGNAYWRAATNTIFRPSAAFSPSTGTISAPFFDKLESIDGELSLPRIWKNEFALGVQNKRGLYMGDVLGEFKTRNAEPNRLQIGNIGFSMVMSEKPYADNLNGLDNMRLDYTNDNWAFGAEYQRNLTDGTNKFDGMSNPVLSLASNAITSDVAYNSGNWSFGARAFSGAITDEEMLDADPTISSQYMPAQLGLAQGAQSDISWQKDKFGFTTAIGLMHESDTLLGAQTGGLLNMGQGDTTYVDTELRYSPYEKLSFKARATFAHTVSDASGEFILGLSDINSNAFAFGMDAGNFSFSVSQPLTVSSGSLQYAYADYEIIETEDGKYDLAINDAHIENVSLKPAARELRLSGSYRHSFGPWTDGAIGFIYRVNPNNTDEFGNESIFMMKMTHRLGI